MEAPTPAALAAFEQAWAAAASAGAGAVDRKKMFGMPAAFVNHNMFLGVFGDGVVLRCSAAVRERLLGEAGVGPFSPRPGRPWKEYVHASASDPAVLAALPDWAREARAHTATLPPKVPKSRKTKG